MKKDLEVKMDRESFDQLVIRRCGKSKDVLSGKAEEYASTVDRFHNFNVAGAAKGETPEQALWGMYMKHWVSVQDMVKSGESPGQAWIDEKIGDSINYLMLLEGLFSSRPQVRGKVVEQVHYEQEDESDDQKLHSPTIEENAKLWRGQM